MIITSYLDACAYRHLAYYQDDVTTNLMPPSVGAKSINGALYIDELNKNASTDSSQERPRHKHLYKKRC
jgi:hypothetical protein